MYRLKQALMRFFAGRRGVDQLGIATYIGGFLLYLLAAIFGIRLFSTLSLAVWVYGIFRMLSKNLYKRERENALFLAKYNPIRRKATQAVNRYRNRKIYKYFRCPKCRSWLKLPRNVGEKTVTCGKCGETFRKKA